MQIYASLKCLPNYSLSLALGVWFSQNLPLKIQTQFKKSLLAMYFFLSFLFFFALLCSVWDSVLAIRNAFFCPLRIFLLTILYRNFACLPTRWSHVTCTVETYFLQMKTDFPHTPSFKTNPLLHLLAVPIHYSRVLLASKTFLTSLFQDRAGLASSAMNNSVLQLATVSCW